MTAWVQTVVTAAIALAAVAPSMAAQTSGDDVKWTNAAIAYVRRLDTGDFDGAAKMAAPTVAEHFTATAMRPIWMQISGGKHATDIVGEAVHAAGALHVVDLAVIFDAKPLRIRVAVDASEHVNGFFLLPSAPLPYATPSYVDTAKFEDWPMSINAGPFKLPARLTLPKDVKNAPFVVLVAGSGPNDMDEAIGPNRPFRDIAWGLASRGIAVLRYDKRTKVAAGNMGNSITVDDEVIADALSALDSGRVNPNIDKKRTFLLGHSLGAMLAPEIASRDRNLAGVIMLAGTPRTLSAVMNDQFTYLKSLPANASADAQSGIVDAQQQLARLMRREPMPDELIMGAPASYFYDLDLRDAMKFAKSVKEPMLFLQGARDYQVLPLDLDLWETGLKGHSNASFKLYTDLNHLFMTGVGKATPTEYTVPGHVKQEVIEDIARFILGK